MGKASPHRPPVRSPARLATPQAGLTHRLGGPSGSAVSLCKRNPQSMHATAPSRSADPQAGHLVGGAAAGMVAGREPLLGSGVEAGRFGSGETAAATGAVAGTTKGWLHEGQRTVLPATLSGTCIDLVQ